MKHFNQISLEFIKYSHLSRSDTYRSFENYINGKKFISPKTRNYVEFYSLPKSMQVMIHDRWEKDRQQNVLKHIEETARRTEYSEAA